MVLLSRVPIRKVFHIVQLLFAVRPKNEGEWKIAKHREREKKRHQLKKCKLQLVLKRKSSGSAFVNNCCHAEMQFVAKNTKKRSWTYLMTMMDQEDRRRWVTFVLLLFTEFDCTQCLPLHWRRISLNDDKGQSFIAKWIFSGRPRPPFHLQNSFCSSSGFCIRLQSSLIWFSRLLLHVTHSNLLLSSCYVVYTAASTYFYPFCDSS